MIGIDIGQELISHRGPGSARCNHAAAEVVTRPGGNPGSPNQACVGAHHLSRKLQMLGHDARLMLAKYVRPYSKGQKNDFRDAEALGESSA